MLDDRIDSLDPLARLGRVDVRAGPIGRSFADGFRHVC